MAEKLKEFFSGTLDITDVYPTAKVVHTTDATSQAVIRDVAVSDSVGNFNLIVNDFAVASLSSSLSGSEIVDVNSSVEVEANLNIWKNVNIGGASANSVYLLDSFRLFNEENYLRNTNYEDKSTDIDSDDSNYNTGAFFVKIGDDFYRMYTDFNSTQNLKKFGANQAVAETIMSANYCPVVYDYEHSFYWKDGASGSKIKKYNALTGETTSHTFSQSISSNSTYSRMTFFDEKLWIICSSGTSRELVVIDVNTWKCDRIPLGTAIPLASSINTFIAVTKIDNSYYFYGGYGSTGYVYKINDFEVSSKYWEQISYYSSFNTHDFGDAQESFVIPTKKGFIYCNSNEIREIDIINTSAGGNYETLFPYISTFRLLEKVEPTTTEIQDYYKDNKINLRITGVEITEVS